MEQTKQILRKSSFVMGESIKTKSINWINENIDILKLGLEQFFFWPKYETNKEPKWIQKTYIEMIIGNGGYF